MLLISCIINLVCSKVILLNIKFLYRQIITPDISLGAHDYYTVSFLMDVISFIIIVIGAQSFGVCLSKSCACICKTKNSIVQQVLCKESSFY